MPRYDALDRVAIREAVSQLNVNELKPLVNLIAARAEGRKADLVEALAKTFENPTRVRALYDGLDAVGKRALEEAAHDPNGLLNLKRFRAKYGDSPDFGGDGRVRNQPGPTMLSLFFPRYLVLPVDLQETLLAFIPEPQPLTVHAIDDLPSRVRRPQLDWGSSYWKPNTEEVEPSVRETARAAMHDVRAVLRLIDAGGVRVGETTRRPSQAAMTAIRGVLADGDFYDQSEQSKGSWDPACDLNMKAESGATRRPRGSEADRLRRCASGSTVGKRPPTAESVRTGRGAPSGLPGSRRVGRPPYAPRTWLCLAAVEIVNHPPKRQNEEEPRMKHGKNMDQNYDEPPRRLP